MHRRTFMKSVFGGSVAVLAGCLESGPDDGESGTSPTSRVRTTTENSERRKTEETATEEPMDEFDVRIEYSVHEQASSSGEYDLPEPTYEDWSWIVVDFEVLEGTIDMSDLWFGALFETEERYRTVDKSTEEAEYGIEPRGSIKSGGRGVMLHSYPPSPRSGLVGPNFSLTDSSIGGEGVNNDGPSDDYPPVSVEYTVETAKNPSVLDDERAERRRDGDEVWAVVTLQVTEGVLNMEDVWFRSQLSTANRIYDIDHTSSFADRGVRSRGFVKQGNVAHALYQIGSDETVESWGYEDGRQNVEMSRR